MHHAGEHVGPVLSSKINNISSKPARFNLGGVNGNDSDILGVLLLLGASIDNDGGRKDNMNPKYSWCWWTIAWRAPL
jgi:hypothetical protein